VVIEKRLERLDKDRKKIKNPELDRDSTCWCGARPRSNRTSRYAQLSIDADDEKRIRGFQFLSRKPVLYV